MGFSGSYVYDGTSWSELDGEVGLLATQPVEPRLSISVHDSDIATVSYAPRGVGTGIAYLGFTPRTYFDDPNASRPTDVALEARGLASWSGALGDGPDERETTNLVASLLASDVDTDADEELDDADVFVEDTVVRLLTALGMPVPDGLLDLE